MTAPTKADTPQVRVEHYSNRVADLRAKQASLQVDLFEASRLRDEAVLEGYPSDELSAQWREHRDELEAIDRAVETAQGNIADAQAEIEHERLTGQVKQLRVDLTEARRRYSAGAAALPAAYQAAVAVVADTVQGLLDRSAAVMADRETIAALVQQLTVFAPQVGEPAPASVGTSDALESVFHEIRDQVSLRALVRAGIQGDGHRAELLRILTEMAGQYRVARRVVVAQTADRLRALPTPPVTEEPAPAVFNSGPPKL